MGEWSYSAPPPFFTTALDRGDCSASRPGRLNPGEWAPGTHWIGRQVQIIRNPKYKLMKLSADSAIVCFVWKKNLVYFAYTNLPLNVIPNLIVVLYFNVSGRTSSLKRKRIWLEFGSFPVRILVGTTTVLTEVFRGFSQSPEWKSGKYLK
jgi:hypothetical protein